MKADRRTCKQLTNHRLDHGDGADEAVLPKTWRSEGKVGVCCYSIKRVDIRNKTETENLSYYRELRSKWGTLKTFHLKNRSHLEYFVWTLCVASTFLTPICASSFSRSIDGRIITSLGVSLFLEVLDMAVAMWGEKRSPRLLTERGVRVCGHKIFHLSLVG